MPYFQDMHNAHAYVLQPACLVGQQGVRS